MRDPVIITCLRAELTAAFEELLFDAVLRLEAFCDRITSCRIVVEGPCACHADAKSFQVKIAFGFADRHFDVSTSQLDAPGALRAALGEAENVLRGVSGHACSCGDGETSSATKQKPRWCVLPDCGATDVCSGLDKRSDHA